MCVVRIRGTWVTNQPGRQSTRIVPAQVVRPPIPPSIALQPPILRPMYPTGNCRLRTPPHSPFYLFHWRGSALLFEQVTYSGPQKTRFYHSKTLNTRSTFIATALVFGPGVLFLSNQIYLDIRAHLPWDHSITSNLSVYLDLNTLSLVSAMGGLFLRKYGSIIPMTSRYLKDFLWRLKYPKCRPSGEDLRNLFDHYINPIGGVGVWDLLYPTHYFLRIQYG